MTTFVAFLRAVNLAGRRRVPMADLRAVLADDGYGTVTTHLQTGNVVLEGRGRAGALGERLEATLADAFGFDIDVMVRSATEMARIARANPFVQRGVDRSTLAVGFLRRRPAAAAARELDDAGFDPEEFALEGSELYLRYPNGLGRSKMSTAFFERKLATPVTVRTWGVVTKLVELSRG
ncbi:MAG TPA: DUF1697 domain-containing protein [Acidimicrobiia bacterium]